jgi:hypothetical protein
MVCKTRPARSIKSPNSLGSSPTFAVAEFPSSANATDEGFSFWQVVVASHDRQRTQARRGQASARRESWPKRPKADVRELQFQCPLLRGKADATNVTGATSTYDPNRSSMADLCRDAQDGSGRAEKFNAADKFNTDIRSGSPNEAAIAPRATILGDEQDEVVRQILFALEDNTRA